MTTLAEYTRDPRKHIELVNGTIVVSPAAAHGHFLAIHALVDILVRHGFHAGGEANMILDDRDGIRTLVRQPDVYVLRDEIDPWELYQRADNARLVVEIVSPGSGITDWVEKMNEYAEAGIHQYWIVEFYGDHSPHLYTFRLIDGVYGDREHWDGDVEIKVADTYVKFNVTDLVRRKTASA
jgi:Uma2 family endonuclease